VDNQNDDSSKVKTHEEILKLFHEVKSVEEKVKNPGEFKKVSFESETILQEIKLPVQISKSTVEEQQPIEPTGEIPLQKKEKTKKSFLKKIETPELQSEEKTHWFAFLKKEKNDNIELEPPTEIEQQPEEIKIDRSTFILQLDNGGNLIGFPMKKPQLEKDKKGLFFSRKKTQQGTEEPEEEPVHGIKGKLIRMVSRLHPKKSDESESSGGIGEKIRGIFKRRNKE
jgi:hypothetical protein